MIRSQLHRGAALSTLFVMSVTIGGLLLAGSPAFAQAAKTAKKGAPEPEKVSGKISEIERKGKLVTFVIERDDGGKLEVMVTPKLGFSVTAKGDQAFLQPRVGISSDKLFVANNELFGKEFNVHLGAAPGAFLRRDPQSAEAYHIGGMITAADAQSVTVNIGAAGKPQKITFEQGAEVTINVVSTDPALVVEGSTVELEGNTRGTKFLPTKLAVTLEQPLTAEDVLADKKGGKTAKTATGSKSAATSKSSKSAKGAKDDPAGDAAGAANDPFGLLGKKDAKGTKAPEKKEADEKKE